MAHLVQFFLPREDGSGTPFAARLFDAVKREMVERFGGVTAFTQAPAEGLWAKEGAGTDRDRVFVFEVVAEDFDAAWWRGYRADLERRFAQERVLMRTSTVALL